MQSGFRPYHSCTTALLKITDNVMKVSDRELCTVLALLDCSKVLDIISHKILLSVLHYVGLSLQAVKLIESYLGIRSQKVTLDDVYSEALRLRMGAPQGSILGPLLYIVYTSNFYKSIFNCQLHMYADDTQWYYSSHLHNVLIAVSTINEDLKSLVETSTKRSLVCCFVHNERPVNVISTRRYGQLMSRRQLVRSQSSNAASKEHYQYIKDAIHQAAYEPLGIYEKNNNERKPYWWYEEIEIDIEGKRKAFQKYSSTKSIEDKIKYKEAQSKLRKKN
ncbi:hypothetical protein ILUMI_06633, partial [Ignelater luminosus]